ncbi:hypothetical protein ABB37_09368 [Leptomonas pyrrhocoris]|uniref:Uncharacterized protein n=1 Tax=Leptomonas pyrrhocoris TaxID=157538 RepID=A0A0M9FQZ0_LEPPY|nr:hypothetical protein ABB37_09368 [Leptomonas pyrrhocoris]XP_015652505.1 hypothetical protein ABB37_09368 [Leptomonas pyrrhocoris]KPA74065.1 hypothetical protein ABB37_09368 [Leptomonas pyrrhocoris]KPA74066.1 hypothetical protein ABB37_09368 [Leptomonas pyrrhocoris]|eukprot:XP_015652504.1 hypothetical protein ABB37_09368 [Leptomonas pyrrhocoris]
MGQRMSSDNQNVKRTKAKKGSTARENVYVLPQEEELLGRCWLLAASADALSPSRWFALSPRGTQGARSPDRRAFSISPHVLSSSERVRQPVLRDLGVNIHRGLTVCGYQNLTVASVDAPAAQRKKSMRVGGVHIDLPPLPATSEDGAVGSSRYVLIAMRRVSVEAELRDYATAAYTRYEVQAPPANDAERRCYGEGCLTGVLYGAVVVLHVASSMNAVARLVQLCETAARSVGVPPSALQVQEEASFVVKAAMDSATQAREESAAATAGSSPDRPSYVHLQSVICGDAAASRLGDGLKRPPSDKTGEALPEEETLRFVAEWAVQVHQTPSAWRPINAFLQRYEAIADSLLLKSKKN